MKFNDPNRKPRDVRHRAADLSTETPLEDHCRNDDENTPFLFSFTKGLGHGLNGLLTSTSDFVQFAVGTEVHEPNNFAATVPYRGPFPEAVLSGIDDYLKQFRR